MKKIGLIVAAGMVAAGAGRAAEVADVTVVSEGMIQVHIVDGHGVFSTLGKPVDEHVEQVPLDLKRAGDPNSWRITGKSPEYAKPRIPARVGRKTKGRDYVTATKPDWHMEWTLEHWIILVLPEPMTPKRKYRVAFPGLVGNAEVAEVTYDPFRVRSEAVHVNQLGYVPEAPGKYAYVSYWAGDLGGVPFGFLRDAWFRVVSRETGRVAFRGKVQMRKKAAGEPDGLQPGEVSHTRADVWECDFSGLKDPGDYAVSVDGVGCSYPFKIDPDVYRTAYATTMRGLYQQRCGTALDPRITPWSRGLCHHPSLAPIYQSKRRFMEGHCDACKEVEATSEKRDAWGGYHDAGDWDREGGHPFVPMMLSLSYELAPANFRDGELGIPEGKNGIPDILDEARWSLDYWRRLQRKDGGVSLGLFMDSFPQLGEAADLDRGNWYVYAEDPEMSYQYAAAACHYAFALGAAGKAADGSPWIESAKKAWGWAEANQREGDAGKVRDTRLHAAACLFRATGEGPYHAAFKKDLLVDKPDTPLWVYDHHDQKWAAWVYAMTDRKEVDVPLREALRQAAVNWARRDSLETAGKRGMRYGYHIWIPLAWGITTVPQTLPLAVAYYLTKDPAFRAVQYTDCDFTLGGNPLNMTWVTHLGSRWPEGGVFHPDSWYHTPDGTVCPGLVPPGPHHYVKEADPKSGPWDVSFVHGSFYPAAKEWPPLELWAAARTCFPMNEHVVAQIAEAAAAYGLLCAPVAK